MATPRPEPTLPKHAPALRPMPEPPRHGVLGHFPDWLGVEQGKRVLQRLERYARETGPVARVPLGPTEIVVVNDAALVAELLSSDDANHKGWTYILTRTVLDNVLLLNGEAWVRGRKLYRAALRDADLLGSVQRECDAWLDDARVNGVPGHVDLARLSQRLLGDALAHFVAGTRIDAALEPDRARIQYELAAVGMDLQCQPWAYASPQRWIALRRSVSRLRAHFGEQVDARCGRGTGASTRTSTRTGTSTSTSTSTRTSTGVGAGVGGADGPRDVLQGVLGLVEEGAHPADALAIADTLINIYFTAHDVLTSSTAWTLWLLAKHPEVQARLHDALCGVALDDAEALCGVDYLGQVVKEGLRLYPGYALFGRNPTRDLVLGSYRVRAGALVIASPFVMHRQERYFERPLQFDPERFAADPHGIPPPRTDGGYFPFGAGHRSCLASRLAFPAMKLTLARLVRAARIEPRIGHVPRLAYCGTGYAENGLWARLKLRG